MHYFSKSDFKTLKSQYAGKIPASDLSNPGSKRKTLRRFKEFLLSNQKSAFRIPNVVTLLIHVSQHEAKQFCEAN